MKKALSLIITMAVMFCLTACGEKPDELYLASAMKAYMVNDFKSDDYYIQMSRTKSEAHTVTEVSKMGDDKCFLAYDANGIIKYFRNGKQYDVSAETLYAPEEKEAKWDDFTYGKTADKYREVLLALCGDSNNDYPVKDVKYEDSDNEKLPYKVSVYYDLSKFDCGKLFGSQGNFGSLSIKFLTDLKGNTFDNVTLHVQYDYNSEIFVAAAKYGEPKTSDENGGIGERPDDIEEIYNIRMKELQTSFEEYFKNLQEQLTT